YRREDRVGRASRLKHHHPAPRLCAGGSPRMAMGHRRQAERAAQAAGRVGARRGSPRTRRVMSEAGLSLAGYDVHAAPAAVVDHPGMTSRREKSMLYWLARNHYAGDGLIVDAGLFLGASTNAFAAGLKDGPGGE